MNIFSSSFFFLLLLLREERVSFIFIFIRFLDVINHIARVLLCILIYYRPFGIFSYLNLRAIITHCEGSSYFKKKFVVNFFFILWNDLKSSDIFLWIEGHPILHWMPARNFIDSLAQQHFKNACLSSFIWYKTDN